MHELPPGPRAPAAVQTVRWLTAPVAFMESCRRRFGDAFSVRFLGFERPMVLLSDPRCDPRAVRGAGARAPAGTHLCAPSDHGAELGAPARGGGASRAPQADAAAVPRRADAGVRADDRRRGGRRGRTLAGRPRLRAPSSDACADVRDHPSRRVRRQRPEPTPATADAPPAVARPHRVADAELPRAARPAAWTARSARGARSPERGDRRAAPRRDRRAACHDGARRALGGHPRPADRSALRGRERDDRPRAARSARHAPAGRSRDHGDLARLDVRPAAAGARRPLAASRRARRGRRRHLPACGRR